MSAESESGEMTTIRPLLRPLVVICGTTGVGKSKLAVELARALRSSSSSPSNARWRGARVVNADAMQVYHGMDVITNKLPLHEREGVEHALMDFKPPGEQYVVGEWVRDAIQAIDETHARGEVPIVVGGTAYWIQHLLFPERLVSRSPRPDRPGPPTEPSPALAASLASLPPELRELFHDLPEQAPSAADDPDGALRLHRLLSALDPPVARRWHWRDARKVLRSLAIVKEGGRAVSEVLKEQSASVSRPRYPTLLFWLYAEPGVLKPRLDARVDEMIKLGLLDEVRALRSRPTEGETMDYTLGIYQSIGFREFDAYLSSIASTTTTSSSSQEQAQEETEMEEREREHARERERAFAQATDAMKISTRQYAKRQVSWIRNKLLPAIAASNAAAAAAAEGEEAPRTRAYLLDATELGERWERNVSGRASEILQAFLDGRPLPDPTSLSDAARAMLGAQYQKTTDPTAVLEARRKRVCEVCTPAPDRPVMIEEGDEWETHKRTRAHRRRAAKLERERGGIGRNRERGEGERVKEVEEMESSGEGGLEDAQRMFGV
ncbi:tRNA isopentenyltransferase [Punctularia strigosozonata HHB-11173 SS5]|uniref:tRNA isopentenyltransferase n=1 Tax=Punctularia strigosozonata (strain HHB-11173) TaxID=741275 RepID=UPI00044186F8|nr:tRNA isopentenyltransferase [Punctularia strigosozonata HHB-11173 SS5]EIN07657.1 tRNA isopentenyltransferase [Punctularia strigosozonata HHB-11173 SS5]